MGDAISSFNPLTAPALDDEFAIVDITATETKKIIFANIMKLINLLTEDVSPADGDFVITYDISTNTVKKVLKSNIGGGLVTLLVDYEATATDVTKSLSFTAVDFNDDSEILIILDGITAGAVNFNFQITGEATGNYFGDGAKIVAGVETLLDQNSFTGCDIVETSILDAADRPFFIVIHLGLNKGGVPNHPMFTSIARGHLGQQVLSGSLRVNKTSIGSVLFGGNWKSGTRVTIYKIKRA